MRFRARPFRGLFLTAAFLAGSQAFGQELQLDQNALDPKALDPAAALASPKGKKAKAAKPAATAPQAAGKPAAGGANRQFGELEGWSPGKEPPKPAEKEHGSAPAKSTGVGVSPSGNMSVGLPF
jgi:hypothetical protein